jgi:hypothetical protein
MPLCGDEHPRKKGTEKRILWTKLHIWKTLVRIGFKKYQ